MRNLKAIISQICAGLRFRLLLLVIVVCGPLGAVMLRSTWEQRRLQVTHFRDLANHCAESALREQNKLVGNARQLLLALAESGPARSNEPHNLAKLLRELHSDHPAYLNLSVVKTNGQVVASATTASTPGLAVSPGLLRRALQQRTFTAGLLAAGQTNSAPVLCFVHPILDARGSSLGAAVATMDLRRADLGDQAMAHQLPRGAAWLQTDSRGIVLGSVPAGRFTLGQPLPDPAIYREVAARNNGILESPDAQGVATVVAFVCFPSEVAAGESATILTISQRNLFAPADQALSRNLGWLALASLLAVFLGWAGGNLLVVRPVNALVQSTKRLANGDLSVRTGLPHSRDELGQLTRAFDQMAKALEQREQERQHASQKLQALSYRLVEVQEAERRHIARELHDEIGQSLTAAEMNLQAALRMPAPAALEKRLAESRDAVGRVLEQVHDLSLNLRPSMLDDLGLAPALRWYTQRQAELTGLVASFQAEGVDLRMDPIIETECFRVAQEALTNVVRHAQARHVVVRLGNLQGKLVLSVRDDGIGFDVAAYREQAVRGASLGLLSMEERATLAGGGLEMISSPAKGTEVRAWFPLAQPVPESVIKAE